MLRAQQIQLTGTTLDNALGKGLTAGLISDVALVLVVVAVGLFFSAIRPRLGKPARLAASLVIWGIATANVCYFSFFHSQLYLWVATSYTENVWSVRSVILRMLERPWILCSAAIYFTFVVSLFIFQKDHVKKFSPGLRLAATRFASACGVIVLALLFRQSPVWLKLPRISESIFGENIVWKWGEDLRKGTWTTRVPMSRYQEILPRASALLDQYALMEGDRFGALRRRSPVESDGKLRQRMDAMLGLPTDRKLNVVVLFLESGRSYELLSPSTSGEIYPELKKVLSTHGILFRQAYSTANYTVQGQFSTLCSRMDRVDAAPVYSRQPYLNVTCLPEVFSKNGYETYWMNPFHRFFAGKYVFESDHGTKHFLDRDYFYSRNAEEARNSTEWGVSDEVFLTQAMDKLEQIHGEGKPFFAHLLTTGTHAPWRSLPDFPLSDELKKRTEHDSDYQGYLSTAKGLDHALGKFFKRFLSSPVSNDTVIVVLGDHGTGVSPDPALSPVQRSLIWPRIILGVVTKRMPRPHEISYPVHQMDVAPLVATIAGIPQSDSWLGREPLLSGEGTPWVKLANSRIYYRTTSRFCGKIQLSKPLQCLSFKPGEDPLFDLHASEIAEDSSETAKFHEIVDANEANLELAGGELGKVSRKL